MFKAAIITASDKGAAGMREDISGTLVRQLLEQQGYQIIDYMVLPDDRESIADRLRHICDNGSADLILTTGGTGFSPRDCTPEATLDVIERQTPGITEAMRYTSMQITPRAMLSRAVAGIRGQTLIINLPGSPKAVRENLNYILPTLAHGLEILLGHTGECGLIR